MALRVFSEGGSVAILSSWIAAGGDTGGSTGASDSVGSVVPLSGLFSILRKGRSDKGFCSVAGACEGVWSASGTGSWFGGVEGAEAAESSFGGGAGADDG